MFQDDARKINYFMVMDGYSEANSGFRFLFRVSVCVCVCVSVSLSVAIAAATYLVWK